MRPRTLLVWALILVFVLVTTGCTQPAEEPGEEPTAGESSEPTEPAEEEEKVIVIAQAGDIERLDRRVSVGTAVEVANAIYDWPWIRRPEIEVGGKCVADVSGKFIANIVENWETKELPNGEAVHTFHVQPGATFHSGNPVTADDLIYWWRSRSDMSRDYLAKTLGGMYETDVLDDKIEKIDDLTVALTVKENRPFFWDIWAQRTVMDSKLLEENKTADDPWALDFARTADSGSGPMKLDEWIPGVRMEVVRFDDYWGEPSKSDRLIFRVVPSLAGRILLLKKGEIDVALNIPAREMNDLAKTDGVKVLSYPSGSQVFGVFNFEMEPFDDVKVRKAFSYAFPYEDVINSVYMGEAQHMGGPVTQPAEIALDERVYDTDLEKAKRLLEEAGYGNGLETTLYYSDEFPEHEQVGLLLQSNLKEIGVDLTLQVVPRAQFLAQTREKELALYLR